jgi:formylglycine-generating enzyme required for sulfatase activity
MSGNVAEWTTCAYHPSAYFFQHDLNPNYEYKHTTGSACDETQSHKGRFMEGYSILPSDKCKGL